MTRSFLRLAGAAYERVGPAARRLLPAPLKRHLARFVGRFEAALAADAETRAAKGAIALRDAKPLLPAEAFTDGPILLANNALAWGGAERQVVNTLLGLSARTTRPVGLLCLKLGEDADYDFYAPALKGLALVRNMTPLGDAKGALQTAFSAEELAQAEAAIAGLPADVRERVWRLLADFTALKPAVIHAWQDAMSIEAGFAAKLAGVPHIIISARNLAPTHFAYFRPYMRVGYLELAACADVIMLNNSDAGARDYAAWLAIAPERYRVVRNGVDLSALAQSTEDLRTRLSVPADAPLIGSIFRFYEEKQPLFWVETAALVASAHADAHFVVFGIGPLLKEARAVAAKHGFAERFHTPGALPGAAHMLSALDVFLLTSQFEGTPNVVLEASAAGVPVVTTKAGGTAEAVEEGVTGYVVDEPDAAKLAARVLAVLGDDAFRARCKAAGPDFVTRRFGLQRMIDETLALYGLG